MFEASRGFRSRAVQRGGNCIVALMADAHLNEVAIELCSIIINIDTSLKNGLFFGDVDIFFVFGLVTWLVRITLAFENSRLNVSLRAWPYQDVVKVRLELYPIGLPLRCDCFDDSLLRRPTSSIKSLARLQSQPALQRRTGQRYAQTTSYDPIPRQLLYAAHAPSQSPPP